MIKIEKLVKLFFTDEIQTIALNEIDFRIEKGEFVSVMGPSGCGKSTMLNILGLLDNPNSGKYYFDGVDVSTFKENQRTELRRGNIGFVFQGFNLIDQLTVQQNIELPLVALGKGVSERKKTALSVMERLEIAHRAKHYPRQLSGGQQQRVAVARAIVTVPKLILADEPTGNLDSKNGEEVMKMLAELNRDGTTIVMVTHSPSHAERAHRTINLFDGKIVGVPVPI
jgi:putative ABC transport system ATP-binding protein